MWMHRQCLSLACVVLLSVWFILGTGNTKLLPTCSTFPLQNTFQSLPGKSLQTSCQPGLQWRQFVYQFTCIPYVPTGAERKPGAGSHTTALTSSPPLQLIWDTHNGGFFSPAWSKNPIVIIIRSPLTLLGWTSLIPPAPFIVVLVQKSFLLTHRHVIWFLFLQVVGKFLS